LSPNIWVRVPLTEIHQGDFSPLFRYTLAIMLLAIGGAWLFIRTFYRRFSAAGFDKVRQGGYQCLRRQAGLYQNSSAQLRRPTAS
ncbi:hypothetical protein MJN51_31500, partial [Salmonella enterica subsp. enterica serovar Kentucky]|nr:hypothetical protein [Salmonella enterica subsp. enterica serovar Kentucky]